MPATVRGFGAHASYQKSTARWRWGAPLPRLRERSEPGAGREGAFSPTHLSSKGTCREKYPQARLRGPVQ
ncbi:unnamed protein product [Caretta caretta]